MYTVEDFIAAADVLERRLKNARNPSQVAAARAELEQLDAYAKKTFGVNLGGGRGLELDAGSKSDRSSAKKKKKTPPPSGSRLWRKAVAAARAATAVWLVWLGANLPAPLSAILHDPMQAGLIGLFASLAAWFVAGRITTTPRTNT